jgi:transposase
VVPTPSGSLFPLSHRWTPDPQTLLLAANKCLKPYEKFAAMMHRRWNGIAAYCRPENKVALGFVKGLTDKIRVLQRRACGFRDEELLRLKTLTCLLPTL